MEEGGQEVFDWWREAGKRCLIGGGRLWQEEFDWWREAGKRSLIGGGRLARGV